MSMALTSQFRVYFDRNSVAVGRQLYKQGHFRTLHIGHSGAQALIEDSRGQTFRTGISFLELTEAETIPMHCSCDMFLEEYSLCEHLWALLEACQEHEIRLSRETRYWDLGICDWSQISVGSLVYDLDDTRQQVSKSKRKKSAKWLAQLQKIANASHADDHSLIAPALYSEVPTDQRLLYVLVLSDLANSSRLIVSLHATRRKKNGQWGVPRTLKLSSDERKSTGNEQDRAALQILQPQYDSSYGYYSYWQQPSTNHFTLDPSLVPQTLQALGKTGRVGWSLADGRDLQLQPLRVDADRPWQLIIRVAPQVTDEGNPTKSLAVTARLVRDNDSIPISEVQAATRDGVFVANDQLAFVPVCQGPELQQWFRVGGINVPRRSLNTLLAEISQLPHSQLELAPELGVTQRVGQPKPQLRLATPKGESLWLDASVQMLYDEHWTDLNSHQTTFWDPQEKCLWQRDLAAESAWTAALDRELFRLDTTNNSLTVSRKSLGDIVTGLTQAGWEVIADGSHVRNVSSFNVSVESGVDWFDLHAVADFDGVTASLPALLAALRKGQDYIVLDDGSHGMLPTQWLEKFAGFEKTGTVQDDAVRFKKNQALLLDAMLAEQENVAFDKAFKAWCEKLNSFEGIAPADPPAGFIGQLRDYQKWGLGWFQFLQEFQIGGCLADDMGLGKTIQVLSLLEQRRQEALQQGVQRPPSLIVVPRSLVFNWMEESARFTPELKVLNYTGTQRKVQRDTFAEYDALVTTYGTLRIDASVLRDQAFDYVILDEAQAIKNPQSLACKAARLMQGEHRLAMTGTPVENHLGDLWSLFEFLNPGMLGNTLGSANGIAQQQDRIGHVSTALRPFILRRTKEQVLTELPEKTEQTLYCDMDPKQRKLYQELRDHYRAKLLNTIQEKGLSQSKIQVLEALLRLRQTACDPRLVHSNSKVVGAKLNRLVEQLEEVLSEGHKALVFSQFTSLLSLVKKELDKHGWKYEYLDGRSRRRGDLVKRFQESDDCSLFLISLKAGGHGLNLTAADYVFILDPWWNPAVEAQAIDRAHRMGQTKPVVAYRMICRDTVEEKIVALQTSKRKLADAIISQEKSLIGELTADDLRMLFG